jgi:hypothetical protein
MGIEDDALEISLSITNPNGKEKFKIRFGHD